jgi:hypothetical protein
MVESMAEICMCKEVGLRQATTRMGIQLEGSGPVADGDLKPLAMPIYVCRKVLVPHVLRPYFRKSLGREDEE